MASRPDHHLNLSFIPQITANQIRSGDSTGNTSPSDAVTSAVRSPFGLPNALNTLGSNNGSTRLGAGSPSHELGSRLYTKRSVFFGPLP